jgi:hypothetical protein
MLIRGSQRKVVRFDQIISCEIREDNASLITTRRGVGGIVLGGLLGGEVGAIVGGIASPQYSTMTAGARSITLLVVTDGTQQSKSCSHVSFRHRRGSRKQEFRCLPQRASERSGLA